MVNSDSYCFVSRIFDGHIIDALLRKYICSDTCMYCCLGAYMMVSFQQPQWLLCQHEQQAHVHHACCESELSYCVPLPPFIISSGNEACKYKVMLVQAWETKVCLQHGKS